jgi:dolichol-phosphate mannosyltransferase
VENNIKLSVILPSYLEEENLRLLLPRLHNTIAELTNDYEILVVDTVNPLDNTEDVCKANKIKYINRENGNAFGDAVRTGIKHAKGEFILFMDADGSHPPEFIPNMYKFITNCDIVIASRYVQGGYTENNKLQTIMSRILNIVYSLVLNLKCKDVSNSFKIYKAQLLKEIKLHSNNFDIVEEILFKISKNHKNVRITEVPFSFKKRMFGQTKRNLIIFVITYIFTLLRLRFGR